jgi:DNA-binding response OmpR family regulator
VNTGARHARGAKRTSSIVVVDDEVASGELIAALLRSQGYGVRLLTDGRAAIELVQSGDVDLLVLDLMMAKLDGAEVCALVRTELRELTLPIVIVTSLQDRESRLRAKEAGADDVLVKPIDALELLVRIESLLRMRAHVVELGRERERLQSELHDKSEQLVARERMLLSWDGTRNALEQLLAEQRALLASARERWSEVREAREQITRFVELDAKVRRVLDQSKRGAAHASDGLSDANSGRAADVDEEGDAGSSAESCGNPSSASK